MKTAAEIRSDGASLTREQRDEVCRKFREEIGGLYAVAIAPMIAAQHACSDDPEGDLQPLAVDGVEVRPVVFPTRVVEPVERAESARVHGAGLTDNGVLDATLVEISVQPHADTVAAGTAQ